uniref:Cilia- and flagella-associated protein 157 n=1 Tax=Syphacia muris TaxID=451379 RepID=A0A0N5AMT0_9BILA
MKLKNEQERATFEADINHLKNEHQLQCAELKRKTEAAERSVEDMAREKAALVATLTKDQDEKTAGLFKEINSLNAALEMKIIENKNLRHENAELQLRVDEIPGKEIEISKLKHRVGELKSVIEQKKNNERQLVAMYRELERLARTRKELSESALMENDMLRFRIEEMETSTTDEEHASKSETQSTLYFTPQLRTKDGRFNPNNESKVSSSSMRLTQSLREANCINREDEILARSIASVYLAQGRNRPPSVDVDTIYAPEGTYVTKNCGFVRKLSSSDDDEGSDDNGSKK